MKLYTLEETAKQLGTSTETIRRYVRKGKIKAFKVGKAWRVQEEHLQEYIKNNMNVKEEN